MSAAIAELQEDVLRLVKGIASLVTAQVMVRKEDSGTISEVINAAMRGIAADAGKKPGVTVLVRLPEWTTSEPESPQPILELKCNVTVFENPMINDGASGTGMAGELIVEAILQRLHYRPIGLGVILTQRAEPVQVEGGLGVAWNVESTIANRTLASETRGTQPRITFSGGLCTIDGGSEPGVAIYYTTDGSFPAPGESGVSTYSAPFAAAADTRVRAATTATGRVLGAVTEGIAT